MAQLGDISDRTLRFYMEKGLIVPHNRSGGRGKASYFSLQDYLGLLFIRELAGHGVKVDQIKYVLDYLRTEGAFLASAVKNITAKDFKNPYKQWTDFLNLEEISSENLLLYVVIFDIKTSQPEAHFKLIPIDSDESIISASEQRHHSDGLVIDMMRLKKASVEDFGE